MHIEHERMSDVFEKFHLCGLPTGAVLHHFSDIDRGDPHDHPWGFTSFVVYGGYVERVFRRNGTSDVVVRKPGDSFHITATHIHRIEQLPMGECWTLIIPEEHERTSRFWQFREDGAHSRAWHETDWTREGSFG